MRARLASDVPDLLIDEFPGYPCQDNLLWVVRDEMGLVDLPVVLLWWKAADVFLHGGYGRGLDAYMTCPFNPDELADKVERLLVVVPSAPQA